jgi:hypothetical protein
MEKSMEMSLSSGLYPLKGIVYMATTPQLRSIVGHFFLLVIAISAATTFLAFMFLWDFHMRFLTKYFQYLISARIVAALLLLLEGALPAALVFAQQTEKIQEQLFDETLKLQNVQPAKTNELETRQLKEMAVQPPPAPHPIKEPHFMRILKPLNVIYEILCDPRMSKVVSNPRTREFSSRALGSFVPFLIPVLAYRDAAFLASDLMKRYWHLKGVSDGEALEALQQKHLWEYRGFGIVACMLTYVPVLSWILNLTNSVGAALFAAKLERSGKQLQSSQPQLQKQAWPLRG